MPKTILVADDEKGIRETLRRLLEYEKYDVLLAEDGLDALQKAENEVVDLVLLEALKHMNAHRRGISVSHL